MCSSSICEGLCCWFFALISSVVRCFLECTSKLLLFGTFCLILYGRWCLVSYSQTDSYGVRFVGYSLGVNNASYGVFIGPGLVLAAPSIWWSVVSPHSGDSYLSIGFFKWAGLGSKSMGSLGQLLYWVWFIGLIFAASSFWYYGCCCTEFGNWVGPAVKLPGPSYQICSWVYDQAWGCSQVLLLVGRDYVISDETVSLGLTYLILGRVLLGQVCFCNTQSLLSPHRALINHVRPSVVARCVCSPSYSYGIQLWNYELAQLVLNTGPMFSCCCCIILKALWRVSLVVRDMASAHAIVLWINHMDNGNVMLVCNSLHFSVSGWSCACILLGSDISPTSLLNFSSCCMFFRCCLLRLPKHVSVTRS